MKVRIQGNSLRFRLKQFEVESFAKDNLVKEELVFGAAMFMRLQFILCAADVSEMHVEYQTGKVTVSIPLVVAEKWTATSLVGFEEKVAMPTGESIKVLIEKDFKCLDSVEEEIGSYPNPKESD